MSQPPQALHQAVFQALLCAQSAAGIHKVSVEAGQFTNDESVKNNLKMISEAAYAASAHAWMAMLALQSHHLEVAQSAAQAAHNAEQVALQGAILLQLPDYKSCRRYDDLCVSPDENTLMAMWQALCSSLSDEFPVPDNLNQRLELVNSEDEGNLS